jgi:hypothetical protein
VESDEEYSELNAAYQAIEESDRDDDDDDDEPVLPMTLREARAAGVALKLLVQENQDSVRMRPYLCVIEGLVR